MADRFLGAVHALTATVGRESQLCRPFLDILPVDGASISTIGDFLGAETVSASDAQAVRLDELQFDFGEGPCWDALATAAPVLEPNVRLEPARRWPAFADAILGENLGAIFAFPLVLGPLRLGAIDLYTVRPTQLSALHIQQAVALSTVVSRVVLLRAFRLAAGSSEPEASDQFSRRAIHQATGMVLIQLQIPANDARLIIQGHAFAAGRSMLDIAEDIISGQLNFADEID